MEPPTETPTAYGPTPKSKEAPLEVVDQNATSPKPDLGFWRRRSSLGLHLLNTPLEKGPSGVRAAGRGHGDHHRQALPEVRAEVDGVPRQLIWLVPGLRGQRSRPQYRRDILA